jgi:nitrogen fixation NifU-like protein
MPPYSEIVRDHFFRPRNAYRMEDADAIGVAGQPGNGPFMVLYLKVEVDRIAKASFQTYGCGPAIAAGSLLSERLSGLSLREARAWRAEKIQTELGGLPPEKRHCAELAANALDGALTRLEVRQIPEPGGTRDSESVHTERGLGRLG